MIKTIINKKDIGNDVIIYQAKNGAIELREDFEHENIWANQAQIANLFGVERSVITKHINNIFKNKELDSNSVCANFAHTAIDGKVYRVIFYSLDVVLFVGYRTNSKRAIEFRKWANTILRDYVIKGYAINRNQISKNYTSFMKSISDIQALLPESISFDPKIIIDLVKEFSSTWLSLNAYDKGSLSTIGTTKRSIKLTGQELTLAIDDFKDELVKNGNATEIFAQERNKGSIEGIVGNIMQSFGGQDLYKTIEEKAVHLLYFIVKDHPFIDGNKRSGAFAFIWFLRKAKIKKSVNINPNALTALTLLIAESNPDKKEQMIALVIQMLS